MSTNEQPLKLAPDEVEFWKAIVLTTIESNLRKWLRFDMDDPEKIADAAVRSLRSRR